MLSSHCGNGVGRLFRNARSRRFSTPRSAIPVSTCCAIRTCGNATRTPQQGGGVQESFLDELLEAEIFGELLEAFNALPPACREVYRLSLEGKPHEEIAELLNISINTIKKHKNNANHFMRKRLKHLLVVEYLLLIDRLADLLK